MLSLIVGWLTMQCSDWSTYLDISVGISLGWTHQGTASISLACILASDATSAQEGVVQLELLTQSGGPETVLALVMSNHWQVNLLQHNLILSNSSELILAPT